MLRQELNIATFEDLLYHFPYRYFDRTQMTKIGDIGPHSEFVQIGGTLINVGEEGDGRKKRLIATLYDESGRIELIWFQNINWVRKSLIEGNRYIVFGKVASFNGYYNISHPEIEALSSETNIPGMQPVYSTTEKLRVRGITNRSFAKLTQALFEKIRQHDIPELLPAEILGRYRLCNATRLCCGCTTPILSCMPRWLSIG